MSLGFKAVQWSREKYIYDAILLAMAGLMYAVKRSVWSDKH